MRWAPLAGLLLGRAPGPSCLRQGGASCVLTRQSLLTASFPSRDAKRRVGTSGAPRDPFDRLCPAAWTHAKPNRIASTDSG